MSTLWFLVVIVPLAFAAGWCGDGSKPDRWLTWVLVTATAYSALKLAWEHEYAWAVFVAVGSLGYLLWRSWRLQHGAGDDEREREPEYGGERQDGDGGADDAPYKPRPFR